MDRPIPSQKENKLFLLYIFDKVGAMTHQQINELIVENGLMEYLDFQLSVAELLDAGLLRAIPAENADILSLTSQAKETLSFFVKQVPHSRLSYIDEIALRWREKFARDRQVEAGYSKSKQGHYIVRLNASEGGFSLVQITLNVSNRAQAMELCEQWRDRSGEAYKALMETLLREKNEDKNEI